MNQFYNRSKKYALNGEAWKYYINKKALFIFPDQYLYFVSRFHPPTESIDQSWVEIFSVFICSPLNQHQKCFNNLWREIKLFGSVMTVIGEKHCGYIFSVCEVFSFAQHWKTAEILSPYVVNCVLLYQIPYPSFRSNLNSVEFYP